MWEVSSRPIETLGRGAKAAWTLGRAARRARRGDADGGKAFRDALADLGFTYVKLGQSLANRPDIVPEGWMEDLRALTDSCAPPPEEEAARVVREELGRDLTELFEREDIESGPFASASLAQVYKARLRQGPLSGRTTTPGPWVAVKVQRDGAKSILWRDFAMLRAACGLLFGKAAYKKLGCAVEEVVDELAESVLRELDFRLEAEQLLEFRRFFSDDARVMAPGVFRELCSERVLVMEWMPGERVDLPETFASDSAKRQFLQAGVECSLRQLLEAGLVHGDPHQGNILAQREGGVVYVDFGNCARVTRKDRLALADAIVSAANADYQGIVECLYRLGFVAPTADFASLANDLRAVWDEELRSTNPATISATRLAMKFNPLLARHPIRVPARFSTIIRALLSAEALCYAVDGGFSIPAAAFPYASRRLLSDPDPEFRTRLLRLVVIGGVLRYDRLLALFHLASSATGAGGPRLPPARSLLAGVSFMMDPNVRYDIIQGAKPVPLGVHARGLTSLASFAARSALASLASLLVRSAKRILLSARKCFAFLRDFSSRRLAFHS